MEINGDVTMEPNNKVKTELVNKSTKDCWLSQFREKDTQNICQKQGEMVDSIEANVESASIHVNEGADDLRMAERYQVRLGFKIIENVYLFSDISPF